jgi:hypothetical protein
MELLCFIENADGENLLLFIVFVVALGHWAKGKK